MSKLQRCLHTLGIYLRGFAMGCADVVPGVSGGTIALITQVYERLITALTRMDLAAVRLLLAGRFGALWRHVDGAFLLPLGLGILSAIFTLANAIAWLLENRPLSVWSFFSGLILASTLYLMKQLDFRHRLRQIGYLLLGIGLVLVINQLSPALVNPQLWLVFVSGFVAISAMLLPGISGSFILLMLGLYHPTLDAVRYLDLLYLACFAGGAGLGFLSFSRLISWLLRHYHHQTLLFLVGLLAGSLQATWPWKMPVEAGEVAANLSPSAYAELMGSDGMAQVLLVAAAAMLLVWAMEWAGARLDRGREAA